jgi:hypothetical protein
MFRLLPLRAWAFGLAFALAGTACTGASPATTAAPSPSAAAARVVGWRGDLQQLLPRMEALHPNLYHGTPKPALEVQVEALEAAVPTANDDELMVGLLRIVAGISAKGRDGHTGAFVWGGGSYPVHSLPLRLWLFGDGLYVVDALSPYRGLVRSRVVEFGATPTAEVLRRLDAVIPRDNPSTVRLLTPRFLLIPEVLHGLGLVDAVGPVPLRVVDRAGRAGTATVRPVPMATYNDWAGPYGLHLPPRGGTLYLSRSEEPLWFELLQGSSTLFVQYNRVEFLSSDLLERLEAAARRPSVKRIVVDIRHNYGGETHAYEPVLDILASRQVTSSRRLFVITGRNTFSAAALFAAEMERRTPAVFVGEPMGGSPNLYGDASEVRLAYCGIVVSVATEYFVRSTPDDPRLTIDPGIPVQLSSSDYFGGRDLGLEAILERED